jgi:hypothetical protein
MPPTIIIDAAISSFTDAFTVDFSLEFTLKESELKPHWILQKMGWVPNKLWTQKLTLPQLSKSLYPSAQPQLANNPDQTDELPIIVLPKHNLWQRNRENGQAFLDSLTAFKQADTSLVQYKKELDQRFQMTSIFQFGARRRIEDEIKKVDEKQTQLHRHGMLVVGAAVNYLHRSVESVSEPEFKNLMAKANTCLTDFGKNNPNKNTPLYNFLNETKTKMGLLIDKTTNIFKTSADKLSTAVAGLRVVPNYSLETEENMFVDFIRGIKALQAINDAPEPDFDIATWKKELAALLLAESGFKGTPDVLANKFFKVKLTMIRRELRFIDERKDIDAAMHTAEVRLKNTYLEVHDGNRMFAFENALVESVKEATVNKLQSVCAGFLINKNIFSPVFGSDGGQFLNLNDVWKVLLETLPDAMKDSGKRKVLAEKFRILNNFAKMTRNNSLDVECAKILKIMESKIASDGLFDQIDYFVRKAIINSIGTAENIFYDPKSDLNEKLAAFDCFSTIKNQLKEIYSDIAGTLKNISKNAIFALNNKLSALSELLKLDDLQKYLGSNFAGLKQYLQVKCKPIFDYVNQGIEKSKSSFQEMLAYLQELFAEGKELFIDLMQVGKESWDELVNEVSSKADNLETHELLAPRSGEEGNGENTAPPHEDFQQPVKATGNVSYFFKPAPAAGPTNEPTFFEALEVGVRNMFSFSS